jgi:hypothetical protein
MLTYRRKAAIETQEVVLDKSFICTACKAQVEHVCDTYQALMTEDLLFELMHDDRERRARWFSKFPGRKNPVGLMPAGGDLIRGPIDEVLHRVATNMEFVRRFYQWGAPEGFPPDPIVGRSWAVFRYMQVHLMADVELFAKYGVLNQPSMARLENERADLNYLLFALLAKGLATNDNTMKARFKLLCPEGLLIGPEERSEPAAVANSRMTERSEVRRPSEM